MRGFGQAAGNVVINGERPSSKSDNLATILGRIPAARVLRVEVGPGDFMWLRAFCPQACYAGGPGRFRYLLYKDVNRHAPLWHGTHGTGR